ncbi:MAG: magnesium protoporphyrin IX methyltransferase [Pseudomonadota bacterium]
MQSLTYQERRGQLETYFDRTAADAWERLTSDAPVGKIRATVRAGRDAMRGTLLSWLPDDLRGARVLDAGCGTGALSVEAAKRGAEVLAIDLSPTMVDLAKQRMPEEVGEGWIDFRTGDMLDPALGEFDYVVAMDSLIHYEADDIVDVLAGLAGRTSSSLLFTFAPRTPALALMHTVGRMFPKGDRAPAIEPVAVDALQAGLGGDQRLESWHSGRTQKISSGFYTSQALELVPE